ncbi:MAG TPA: Calx-beta domain-containing protein, partial [Verrucomicrobiota bacterium]|nr:Calx-beta domain-containing protein [Verrucomicrobiota bacterium]
TGVLEFAPGQASSTFVVAILNDDVVEGAETISVALTNPQPVRGRWEKAILGTPNMATLTVIDDESVNEPAGSVDTAFNPGAGANDFVNVVALLPDDKFMIGGDFTQVNGLFRDRLARLNADGTIDSTFDLGLGVNDSVRAIAIQPDGRAILAGFFTSVNGENRNRIARLNYDGSLDGTFNPGGGADNPVQSVVLQPDGRVLIGGDFVSYNGNNSSRLARLNSDGSLDQGFDIGTGADLVVNALAIQPDGRVVTVGDFAHFNGVPLPGIARLNSDGSVDESFNPGTGFNDSVRLVEVQEDGRILVGGFFTEFNGAVRNRVARLMPDGSLDESFDVGAGANGSVYAMAIQSDGKILIGGSFSTFNNLNRNGIVRLNPDGSVDTSINFGTGANGSVLDIAVLPNYKILIGGGFTLFDGLEREYFTQLHGGIIEGQGTLEFAEPFYSISETGTNATVRVVRRGGLSGGVQVRINTLLSAGDTPAVPGLDFESVDQVLDFPEGEVLQKVQINIIDDSDVEPNETVDMQLSDFTDGTQGLQSRALLEIVSDDSVLSFSAPTYSIGEDAKSGFARIQVDRLGSNIGETTVAFLTATNGTAEAVLDFQMVSNTVKFADGEITMSVNVPIVDDTEVEGRESVVLLLTNVIGKAILGLDVSMLQIVDNDFAPGEFYFEKPTFRVEETAGFATVTVVRTNGYTGLVELDYSTSDLTAIAGDDYRGITGKLVFGDGESVKSLDIPVLDDKLEEGAEAFRIRIFGATGGGQVIPPNFSTVIIVDNELQNGPAGPKGEGADKPVYAVAMDVGNNALVAGEFNEVNAKGAPRLARIKINGVLDAEFDVGAGPNNTVFSMQLDDIDSIYIGGLFNQVDGVTRKHLARLTADGAVDAAFDPGSRVGGTVFDIALGWGRVLAAGDAGVVALALDGSRAGDFAPPAIDGDVFAVALQPNGKIVIGGEFTRVNDVTRNNVARLNRDGSLDESFDPGVGPNASVHALAVDRDGILIGGLFVTVEGLSSRRLARLGFDGRLSRDFMVGSGFNGPVQTIYHRVDGRYLIGGSFGNYDGAIQDNVTLINGDGSLANNELGMLSLNGPVYSVSELPGGSSVFGGSFIKRDERGYNRFALLDYLSSVQPPSLGLLTGEAGYRLTVSGAAGQTYYLEFSGDLIEWLGLSRVTIPEEGTVVIDLGSAAGNRYYRAVYRE